MAAVRYSRVFTLEVDGRPVVAFEAVTASGAKQLAKEPWLLDDLMIFTSEGTPLRNSRSRLYVRLATADEVAVFRKVALAATPSDELVLAYLVDLDRKQRA